MVFLQKIKNFGQHFSFCTLNVNQAGRTYILYRPTRISLLSSSHAWVVFGVQHTFD